MKKQKKKPNLKKLVLKLLLSLFLAAGILVLLKQIFPEQSKSGIGVMQSYGKEVLLILPPVLVLMGLAEVWVPGDKVKHYLGREAGLRGALLSLLLGSLPTGPLFIAFPLAGEMLHKGASVSNVVIFLGAWAALKMPQIGVEIQFLGLEFAFYRAVLTFVSLLLIGYIIGRITGGYAES